MAVQKNEPQRYKDTKTTQRRRFSLCFLCASVPLWFVLPSSATAGDIGFVEDFALAKDRAAALKQLIPGTEDYYFYHTTAAGRPQHSMGSFRAAIGRQGPHPV